MQETNSKMKSCNACGKSHLQPDKYCKPCMVRIIQIKCDIPLAMSLVTVAILEKGAASGHRSGTDEGYERGLKDGYKRAKQEERARP